MDSAAFYNEQVLSCGSYWFLDKKKHKYKKILKIFSLKNKFPQSPESSKKHSSEYNDL